MPLGPGQFIVPPPDVSTASSPARKAPQPCIAKVDDSAGFVLFFL